MMWRAMSWSWLLITALLLVGCGSSGIEAGMPQDAAAVDPSKVPDPMAGIKLHSTAKGKAVFHDPMNPGAN